MGEQINRLRVFTIADFKEEEQWLREMHRAGWKLVRTIPPVLFRFERCEPEDVVYQLDFRTKQDGYGMGYRQMFEDCGWDYVDDCMSFRYFRKPVSRMKEIEGIFSDRESQLEMLGRIWRWRMLPLFVILFGCILPQIHRTVTGRCPVDAIFIMYCVFLLLYAWVILHVGIKSFLMKRSRNPEKNI
ncbi:MAG: DUF2812 domain-containing protein [bacterium]|nr:DUF2812 domain-containing protein [bacterium]MCM1374725.1 DUF2812 domain-containing protein [Muribaculum sp.]